MTISNPIEVACLAALAGGIPAFMSGCSDRVPYRIECIVPDGFSGLLVVAQAESTDDGVIRPDAAGNWTLDFTRDAMTLCESIPFDDWYEMRVLTDDGDQIEWRTTYSRENARIFRAWLVNGSDSEIVFVAVGIERDMGDQIDAAMQPFLRPTRPSRDEILMHLREVGVLTDPSVTQIGDGGG